MKKSEGLLKRMIKEEWRMHSTLYRGRSFAAFPILVFLFTFAFAYATANYSTLGAAPVGTAAVIMAGFLGLAVGNLGFSSRDAMKNILGDTNYLVYSSRTLPASRKRLLSTFVIKDFLYYSFLFIAPIAAGAVAGAGLTILKSVALMIPAFIAGIIGSFALARVSVRRPTVSFLDFGRIEAMEPMGDKSLMDVLRSSGGLFKVFFSLGILTAFYWYVVLFFPMTRVLLNNPLISYSVMIGLLNLSVYNWVNRFDSLEDYLHLPLDRRKLLTGKQEAYILITFPLTFLLITASWFFYPENYFISLATGFGATLYNLAVAIYTTGLEPNERLFDTWVFIKYMLLENLVAGPLLALSIVYSPAVFPYYGTILILSVTASLIYLYYRDEKDRYVLTDFGRRN